MELEREDYLAEAELEQEVERLASEDPDVMAFEQGVLYLGRLSVSCKGVYDLLAEELISKVDSTSPDEETLFETGEEGKVTPTLYLPKP